MSAVNAGEISYEGFSIFDREALFTNYRIDRSTVPEGLYAYDLRDECDGEICQLKSHVLVNQWGTILVREPFEDAAEGIEVTPEDYSYEGETLTLAEFLNPEPKASFTLTME